MNIIPILDAIYAPRAWFLALSPYISMTITGLVIAALLTFSGFLLARMGYKPLWALLILVPFGADIIALWTLAYRPFPREKISA
jgi:ABC-type transport system involved in cytochrome bd biosynthesis fused ATPase/permease subunit